MSKSPMRTETSVGESMESVRQLEGLKVQLESENRAFLV